MGILNQNSSTDMGIKPAKERTLIMIMNEEVKKQYETSIQFEKNA